MKRTLTAIVAAIVCCAAVHPAWGQAPKTPYRWPGLPDKAEIQRVIGYKTRTGMVVLEKRTDLTIRSYFADPPGIRRDEFLRFLVTNEEGVRGASFNVNDDVEAKVEVIEARTVAADGTVTTAEAKRDITKVEVSSLDAKEALSSLAKVNFPAPAVGAILDLHVVTYRAGNVDYLMEPIAVEDTPSLTTTMSVHIEGGLPGYQWSILTLGEDSAQTKMASKGNGTVEISVGTIVPRHKEPDTLPFYRRLTTLLCYINFAGKKFQAPPGGFHSDSYDQDPRGRIVNFNWRDDQVSKWWVDYLQQEDRLSKEFLGSAGPASDVQMEVVAPAALPLEERVQKLYQYVQTRLTYNPEAENVTTLSALLKRGMVREWQGNLFFAYLLGRAHIPCQYTFLLNRYDLLFSPIVNNTGLYGFYQAVAVDIPGKGLVHLTPGDLAMPYGCLDRRYQNGMAVWLEPGGKLAWGYTPVNPADSDLMAFTYDAELQADGSLRGGLTLEQTGAPANALAWHHLLLDYRKAHPDKKDKKSDSEKAQAEEKRIGEEFEMPGTRAVLSGHAMGEVPKTPWGPMQVKCQFQAEGMAQPARDRWLLCLNPLLAGFSSPFTEEERKTPIWYEKGGHVVMKGTIRLPKGAKVLEVPKAEAVAGPDRTRITFSVSAEEADGVPVLKTTLNYDQPLIIGYDRYKAWQYYQAGLARLGEARCVVSLPEQGGLE